LAITTLVATLSATAVMAQDSNDASGLSSVPGYTDKELKCLSDSMCVNDPQACLSCLGISSDDIDAAVDCMLECPQPTSLNNMGPYMECANKCSSSMYNKAGSKSSSNKPTSSDDGEEDDADETSSASGKDSASASKPSSSTNGSSDSNDGSEEFLDDGSGASAAAMSMALVAALPVAALAAL
ncbi:hypothetical protein H4R35_001741, partial [Dimargaris xerosporica]